MDLRLGPKGKICGICHYGGAVVACSTDKSIKVLKLYRRVVENLSASLVSSKNEIIIYCFSHLVLFHCCILLHPTNVYPEINAFV